MSTATKVGAYLAGLAVVFAAALGLGNAVGPLGPAGEQDRPVQTDTGHGGMDTDEHTGG
ncbi:hypothetical protein ACWKWC_10435 [Geodermatophilus nigrescens]